jgi:CRP/FNR family transcriptional regulator, cyclic AMP receptor protein
MENKLWYLKRSKLFERASDDTVANCEHLFVQKTVPAKTVIFDQGDDARLVYLVKRGKVKIAHLTEDGKEVLISVLGPGDLFGEEVVFNDEKLERTTIARCLEPTLLCMARADDIYAMLSRNPVLALNIAKFLREQRDDALAIVEEVAYLKVQDRLIRLLERLAHEHGVPSEQGTLLNIRLTHAEIASLIGSTRETVTLHMSNLVRDGYLCMSGKSMVLANARPAVAT